MDLSELMRDITGTLEKNTDTKAIFGEPIREGAVTIVPIAKLTIQGGGGGGRGDVDTEEEGKTGGSGMGMGLAVRTVPVGYIRIDGEKAVFMPILEITKIAIAGIIAAPFVMFALSRMVRKRRRKGIW